MSTNCCYTDRLITALWLRLSEQLHNRSQSLINKAQPFNLLAGASHSITQCSVRVELGLSIVSSYYANPVHPATSLLWCNRNNDWPGRELRLCNRRRCLLSIPKSFNNFQRIKFPQTWYEPHCNHKLLNPQSWAKNVMATHLRWNWCL